MHHGLLLGRSILFAFSSSFLFLYQCGDGVGTMMHHGLLLGRSILFAFSTSFGSLLQAFLPLLLSLGTIIVQKTEHLSCALPIQGSVELIEGRRDLQAGLEDRLLSLQADILWPSDKPAQVTLGLNVLTDFEVAGTSDKQGVFHSFNFGLLDGQRGCCHLLSLLLCLFLNHIARC